MAAAAAITTPTAPVAIASTRVSDRASQLTKGSAEKAAEVAQERIIVLALLILSQRRV
jgi:hypothetical protein